MSARNEGKKNLKDHRSPPSVSPSLRILLGRHRFRFRTMSTDANEEMDPGIFFLSVRRGRGTVTKITDEKKKKNRHKSNGISVTQPLTYLLREKHGKRWLERKRRVNKVR